MVFLAAGVAGRTAHVGSDLMNIFAALVVRIGFGRCESLDMALAAILLVVAHGCFGKWHACQASIPDVGGFKRHIGCESAAAFPTFVGLLSKTGGHDPGVDGSVTFRQNRFYRHA